MVIVLKKQQFRQDSLNGHCVKDTAVKTGLEWLLCLGYSSVGLTPLYSKSIGYPTQELTSRYETKNGACYDGRADRRIMKFVEIASRSKVCVITMITEVYSK